MRIFAGQKKWMVQDYHPDWGVQCCFDSPDVIPKCPDHNYTVSVATLSEALHRSNSWCSVGCGWLVGLMLTFPLSAGQSMYTPQTKDLCCRHNTKKTIFKWLNLVFDASLIDSDGI